MSPQLEIARVALGVAEGKASVHKDGSWSCQKSTWIRVGVGVRVRVGNRVRVLVCVRGGARDGARARVRGYGLKIVVGY
tara:strand:- start:19 stop:255 length:237 start_codon:yes stop_codon:yes gene_type:complete